MKWATRMDPSFIQLRFFNLVELLILQLSAADVLSFNVAEECRSLMSSNTCNIPYFTDKFLTKLNKADSLFLLKIMLLPYMSWFDHSILKQLVSASQSKAADKLLQQFDSLIDYSQPITSYPIPEPSQLMIPLDDSDYTLVATKCDCDLQEMTLQKIVDNKALLVNKWDITEHALQLMAIHITRRILYWMIPKCLIPIVEDKIDDTAQFDLWCNGVIMVSIYPAKNSLETISVKGNPFCLLIKVSYSICLLFESHQLSSNFCRINSHSL